MTFALSPRTLHFVIYGQLRTLFSLLIVLALAAGFLWGGFHVLGTVTGSAAPPAATATPAAVTEAPTIVPTASPKTRKPSVAPAKHATPRPAKSPTPRPSPTPQGPPKVIMTSASTYPPSNPSKVFHLSDGLFQVVCWARNDTVPAGAAVTFTWYDDTTNKQLYQYPQPRSGSDYTGVFFRYVAAGKYRCDVTVNGKPLGSAHYTVAP